MVIVFWTLFGLTVALIVATLWAGLTHRRRVHYSLAVSTVLALTATVVVTEQLVRARDFPREELDFHKLLAKTAAALVLPVIATGLTLVRRPKWRRVHLLCVVLFLVMVLVATGTGIWVYSLSTPKVI